MYPIEEIKTKLVAGITGSKVEVKDLTGTGDHFEVKIVTPAFEGKNSLERHRTVYQVLGNVVGAEIHALTLKTLTPSEE